MSYLGDRLAGDSIYFKFTSVNTSGVPTAITTPVLAVYKNNSTTESQAGLTLTASFDGLAGLNHVTIDTSQDGTFYANGSDFQVIVVTGSVSSNSIVGYTLADFSLANRSALRPTTAGRTLDVSAGGEAGLDWANIGSPTTTNNLSGTTIKTATDIQADTDDIQSRLPAALGANGNIKADVRDYNGVAGSFASGRPEVNTTHWKGTAAATVDTAGYPVVTVKDGTGAGEIATTSGAIDTVTSVTNGVTVTTNNDKTGYRLSATGVDDVWDEPLAAHTTGDTPGQVLNMLTQDSVILSSDVALGSIVGQLLDNGTSWSYDRTTDSLEALQGQIETIDDFLDTEIAAIKTKTDQLTFTTANKVDATIQAAGDFAQAAADKVWSTASRTLTAFGFSVTVGTNSDKTGYSLSAAGIQAIWDALTSALTTTGSIGKLLVDNINATISSRSSHSAADVWAVATRILTAGTNIVLAKGIEVTGFNDLSAAQVNAEVVDALNVDTYAEPGQEAPPATTTLAKKLNYLYKSFRNKKTQTATTLNLYADDGTTVDQKATISDDGTTYTHNELGTGP